MHGHICVYVGMNTHNTHVCTYICTHKYIYVSMCVCKYACMCVYPYMLYQNIGLGMYIGRHT